MVYYKSTNRFIWFTTNPQTGEYGFLTDLHTRLNSLLKNPQTRLSGLLTDLHTGLNGLLTDLNTSSIGLLQSHKLVYLVYYKSTNRCIWFTK